MNCVIIEDELAGQEIIKYKLNQYFPEIKILKIIENKQEAIEFIKSNSEIDLIFVDIEIKGGNSIEFFSDLGLIKFEIIFITAYENFAIHAFKIGATHYLLKPFKDVDFKTAVQRVIDNSTNDIDLVLKIPYKNEWVSIPFSDIIYLKSDGSYTNIISTNKTYISSKKLGDFEKNIENSNFFRVHHSYIVNLSKIEKIIKGRNGKIHLANNDIIPISQRKINDFLVKFSINT